MVLNLSESQRLHYPIRAQQRINSLACSLNVVPHDSGQAVSYLLQDVVLPSPRTAA